MSRPVRVVIAIVAIQAALIGIYWLVEHKRSPDGATRSELSTAPPERVDGSMQPLALRRRDGSRFELRTPDRFTLVHFWATWCPPCRTELPGILAVSEKLPLDIVAIALDKDWADVERFLNGRTPATVFLGDSAEVESAFGVRALPVTYLVEPNGGLRFRFDGARDWSNATFLKTWIKDAANE